MAASPGAGASKTEEVAAPMPAPVSAMPSYSYYGNFVSGPLGPMKLESATEAKAPGAAGSMRVVTERVVKPVLGDWAADAALVSSTGTVDSAGNPVDWSFVYSSSAHREAMLFFIGAQESRVILLKWAPVVLDAASIKVDGSEAIQVVTSAIANASFKSLEEKSGQDFFLKQLGGDGSGWGAVGASSGGPVNATTIAVPPSIPQVAPMPPVEGERGKLLSPGVTPQVTQDVLHSLTPGGTWSVRLQAIGTYQVWDMNYTAPADTAAISPAHNPPLAGETSTYTSNWVSALVDARTGEVIRLTRPSRITTTWVNSSN
jgi:hypothetical protein